MSLSTIRRVTAGVASALSLATLITVTACSSTTTGSSLAALQERAKSCPEDTSLNTFDGFDGTGSTQDEALLITRWEAVREHLTKAAVCAGHARVVVLSSSSATSTVLFDGDLHPTGATPNARLRRVEDLVNTALTTAQSAYGLILPTLDADGTDMTAAYYALVDYIAERDDLGGDQVFGARVETDGVQNVGVDLSIPSLNVQMAEALASAIEMPQLDDRVSVTFLGIGKVAGTDQPPTEYVNALKAFWSATCHATGAKSCTVLTDFTGGSQ